MIDSNVPRPLYDAICRELDVGESIVWLEQPDPVLYRRVSGIFGVFLGITVSAGALYLLTEGIAGNLRSGGGPMPMSHVLTLFILIMLLAMFLLASPLYNRWTARNLAYAITDRRVLTVERSPFVSVQFMSFAADKLEPRSTVCADGMSGDIELIAYRVYDDYTSLDLTVLRALRNVRTTEQALRALIQSSSKSSL